MLAPLIEGEPVQYVVTKTILLLFAATVMLPLAAWFTITVDPSCVTGLAAATVGLRLIFMMLPLTAVVLV
jgi:hypothetical protein